jgi:hypothetical protein
VQITHNTSMETIPGNPFRGTDAPVRAFAHLAAHHGVPPRAASDRLHAMKQRHGVGAAEDVVIERTGGVFRETPVEWLGTLTAKST